MVPDSPAAMLRRPTGRVLVVDDEPEVRSMVTWQLEAEGFEVLEAADGEQALRAVQEGQPDLLVLDLSLPGQGGLEVLSTLRRSGTMPVIVLTARRDETDRIVALDLGADDYVVKPFSPRELAARARSVLRRTQVAEPPRPLRYGRLEVDPVARIACRDGTAVVLTAREFDLLAYLAAHPMRDLYPEPAAGGALGVVLGLASGGDRDRACSPAAPEGRGRPGPPRYIVTVRNAGYRFEGAMA
jgi:two-component system, OmpR family, phosphate regulon response regulator PhoB